MHVHMSLVTEIVLASDSWLKISFLIVHTFQLSLFLYFRLAIWYFGFNMASNRLNTTSSTIDVGWLSTHIISAMALWICLALGSSIFHLLSNVPSMVAWRNDDSAAGNSSVVFDDEGLTEGRIGFGEWMGCCNCVYSHTFHFIWLISFCIKCPNTWFFLALIFGISQ